MMRRPRTATPPVGVELQLDARASLTGDLKVDRDAV